MKVLLISSLGALLLTGCDNFQLQKPLTAKKVPGFTILQNGGDTQVNNIPTQTGDAAKKSAPVINTDSQTVPSAQKPADSTAGVNFPAPVPPAAATATTTTAQQAEPAKAEPAKTAQTTTASTSTTSTIGSSPIAGLKKAEKTETPAASEQKGEAAPAKAEEKAAPAAPKEKVATVSAETAAPEEKEKKPEAASETPAKKDETATATDAAAAPAEEKAAAKPAAEAKPATPMAPNVMTIVEYINLQTVLTGQFGEKALPIVIKPAYAEGISKADLKVDFSGNYDKFTYKVSAKDTVIAEFKDVKIKLNAFNNYANKGYEMVAACSGAKCDMLFVSAIKFNEQRQIEANYPMIFKLVEGKYAIAGFKTSDEYAADRNTLPDPRKIPIVPQISVSQKLQVYLDNNGPKLLEAIKKQLTADETLAYSDKVIAQPTMNAGKFVPEFSREAGKLVISGQVELIGPKKPLVFKTEVKNEPAGVVVQNESGLSMTVVPRVPDQVYAVIMTQQKYTSKIAKVNKAEQVLVCALVEEEGNQFTECMAIPASLVLGEETAVEGNAKEKIKEEAK